MTEKNIIVDITSSGIECKVVCPDCWSVRILSKASGENFSTFNFLRHYNNTHKKSSIENAKENAEDLDVSMNDIHGGDSVHNDYDQNDRQCI